MAKLVAVCRDEEFPFERRQIPLMIEETLTMVMEIPETLISTECVDEADVKHFLKRYDLLTTDELICALMVSQKELFSLLAVSVPCVGCRRSVERLYSQLLESSQPALEPLIIKSSRVLTLSKGFLLDPRLIYALFYIHGSHLNDMVDTIPKSRRNRRCVLHSLETHKTRSLGWMDVWDLLSQECRDEVVLIDSDSLLETLENYLRKHRFCSECKSKVIKAYNILSGDIDGDPDKGYCATLYEGLKSCPKERHIHVLCDTDFIAHLIDRAEPELAGGRRERHARTIEIAQEEVLTCLGIHLWERLHRLWQKLRAEEQTWQMLFYLGVEALRKSFEVAVEDKQGISRLEQVVEEISEAERAKELKKEHKRLKRKKRKENKCKFANENEKSETILTNGEEATMHEEDKKESENIGKPDQEHLSSNSCKEGQVKNVDIEVNGNHENLHENDENIENFDTSYCKEKVAKNENYMNIQQENCKCGDEKSALTWKNGFISLPEEKPHQNRQNNSKKQRRMQSNGFVNPSICNFCGQSISVHSKCERAVLNRGKDLLQYTEICAKCSSLNSDVVGKRNRKKFGRQRDLKDHDSLNSRQRNDTKTSAKQQNRPDMVHRSGYDNDNDDAELKLLKSMGWNSSEREHFEDSGQIAFADDAFISEQELKEFQAKKKDLQSQREELREKLRQQFQTMCIKPTCNCTTPVNGIKINK